MITIPPVPTVATATTKFHKISALTTLISNCINLAKLVDTANLTVAEVNAVANSQDGARGVTRIFSLGMLADKEQEHLDRELVYMVQNLMASKIEAAVTELEAMGVTLEERLYSEYTQSPEDRL